MFITNQIESKLQADTFSQQNKNILIYQQVIIMKGKVAVITASCTGIGKAIAQRLAQQGAIVIVSNKDQEHIAETVAQFKAKGYQVHGMVCDVTKRQDRIKLLSETDRLFGKINYLVPNAAINGKQGKFFQAKQQDLKQLWFINYHTTFMLVQQALPYLKKQKDSAIAITASVAGYDLVQQIGHYSITKTALIALTKLIAKQLMDDQIRVNCVCPGVIKTNFSHFLWRRGEEKAIRYNGVKRLGVPEDIAKVVHFLLSSDSSYMTGESIVVAGRAGSRL